MRGYLTAKTAGYNYTFTVVPHDIIEQSGDKHQIIHEFDDGSVKVASVSSQSYFEEILKFDVLTVAELAAIYDHTTD